MSLKISTQKVDRVLERTTVTTNQNGEVQRFDSTEVKLKNKEREEFYILFTKHVSILGNLGKRANEVLAILLQSKVTWANEVLLDGVTRNEISEKLGTTLQPIKNAISELVRNDILLMKKVTGGYKYALNPHLFGRGKWNEIEDLKIQITKEFDFKNQHFKETIDTITKYEGLPDKKNINVLESSEIETEKGIARSALIEDLSTKEDTPAPKTLDELFNMRPYRTNNQAIIEAEQNKDLRDLAYKDLDIGE